MIFPEAIVHFVARKKIEIRVLGNAAAIGRSLDE
jgi:hypothetical protein